MQFICFHRQICFYEDNPPVFLILRSLTLTLLVLKLISLWNHYRARLAFTSMQSDQAQYCWLNNYQVLILISLKMIMDSSKKKEDGLFHFRNSAVKGLKLSFVFANFVVKWRCGE